VLVHINDVLNLPHVFLGTGQALLYQIGKFGFVLPYLLLGLRCGAILTVIQAAVVHVLVRNYVALLVGVYLLDARQEVLRQADEACFGVVHLLLMIYLVSIDNENSLLSQLVSVGLENIVLLVPEGTLGAEQEVFLGDLVLDLLDL
jgi:hypothetical protein